MQQQQGQRERPPLCAQAGKTSRPVGKCVIPHTWGGQPRVCVHSLFRHKHTFFLCVRLSLRSALGLFSRRNSSVRESSKQEVFYVAETFHF